MSDIFNNQNRLIFLISKNNLTSKQIAEICSVSVGTVGGWRTFNMSRSIPDNQLAKIESYVSTNNKK